MAISLPFLVFNDAMITERALGSIADKLNKEGKYADVYRGLYFAFSQIEHGMDFEQGLDDDQFFPPTGYDDRPTQDVEQENLGEKLIKMILNAPFTAVCFNAAPPWFIVLLLREMIDRGADRVAVRSLEFNAPVPRSFFDPPMGEIFPLIQRLADFDEPITVFWNHQNAATGRLVTSMFLFRADAFSKEQFKTRITDLRTARFVGEVRTPIVYLLVQIADSNPVAKVRPNADYLRHFGAPLVPNEEFKLKNTFAFLGTLHFFGGSTAMARRKRDEAMAFPALRTVVVDNVSIHRELEAYVRTANNFYSYGETYVVPDYLEILQRNAGEGAVSLPWVDWRLPASSVDQNVRSNEGRSFPRMLAQLKTLHFFASRTRASMATLSALNRIAMPALRTVNILALLTTDRQVELHAMFAQIAMLLIGLPPAPGRPQRPRVSATIVLSDVQHLLMPQRNRDPEAVNMVVELMQFLDAVKDHAAVEFKPPIPPELLAAGARRMRR